MSVARVAFGAAPEEGVAGWIVMETVSRGLPGSLTGFWNHIYVKNRSDWDPAVCSLY